MAVTELDLDAISTSAGEMGTTNPDPNPKPNPDPNPNPIPNPNPNQVRVGRLPLGCTLRSTSCRVGVLVTEVRAGGP